MKGDMFDLTDRIVIVTGGSGLIGTHVSRALDNYGANVVVADIDESKGKDVVAQLNKGLYKKLDITDSDSIESLCTSVISEFGHIDGLVNLAYPRTDSYGLPLQSVTKEEFLENLSLHMGGYYAMTKEVAFRMLKQGQDGSIVNFSSIYGMQAPDFSMYDGTNMTSPVEYSVIKAGILNFTRYLASYMGEDGIRVNTVSPGGVFNDQNEKFVSNYEHEVPMGRMAEPMEMAGAVIYLLSDAASYVTGHNLVVDGGWTIK